MNRCLENDKSQDEILNQRIEAQKNIKLKLLQLSLLIIKNILGNQII